MQSRGRAILPTGAGLRANSAEGEFFRILGITCTLAGTKGYFLVEKSGYLRRASSRDAIWAAFVESQRVKFEYWRNDLFQKWHWQLVAEDGTVIAMSREPYATQDACLASIRTFQAAVRQVAVIEVKSPKPDYYRTQAANFTELPDEDRGLG